MHFVSKEVNLRLRTLSTRCSSLWNINNLAMRTKEVLVYPIDKPCVLNERSYYQTEPYHTLYRLYSFKQAFGIFTSQCAVYVLVLITVWSVKGPHCRFTILINIFPLKLNCLLLQSRLSIGTMYGKGTWIVWKANWYVSASKSRRCNLMTRTISTHEHVFALIFELVLFLKWNDATLVHLGKLIYQDVVNNDGHMRLYTISAFKMYRFAILEDTAPALYTSCPIYQLPRWLLIHITLK